jgi:serine-type D-Ala-D-Ala carboxypeptidase/endopeptidase (penicillin-binding protein 4)
LTTLPIPGASYGSAQIGRSRRGGRAALALALVASALALGAPAAHAATAREALRAALGRTMQLAGPRSAAVVLDLDTGRTLFSVRPDSPLIPASLEKLYVTSTALLRLGPDYRIPTALAGDGGLDPDGTFRGDLYLKGAGDPTFGSDRFTRAAYGTGARASALADALIDAGIERVAGRVYGDESYFDRRRGVPSSGYALTRDVGPLSALSFDHGLEPGLRLQRSPAAFAARRLVSALVAAGVRVSRRVAVRAAPASAPQIVAVTSPPLSTLVRLTNRPSDNFFAEMLLKGLGARFGGAGSTGAGAAVVARQLARLGIRARIVDGSGLSRADRTSARAVVALLEHMRTGPAGLALRNSLPVAGRNGTLRRRMRRGWARDRCRAKTGTLRDVSKPRGLLPGRQRRHHRLRLPHEPGLRAGGPRPAGPDGRGAGTLRRRGLAPVQQREQPGLVEHFDAEALGLLEL